MVNQTVAHLGCVDELQAMTYQQKRDEIVTKLDHRHSNAMWAIDTARPASPLADHQSVFPVNEFQW